jgi:hypothetical protein
MEVNLKSTRGNIRRFAFPHEVVEDPSLSIAEKRAILSEWASDASAVESFPTLRLLRGTSFPVTFSAVMDARDQLDREVAESFEIEHDPLHRLVVADFARRRRDNSAER